MNIDSDSQTLAQEGLRQIETAILRLLDASPRGLRNAEIADSLGLHSHFQGRQKDYLTYSILGGLLARGRITWDQGTKVFTASSSAFTPEDEAQKGLKQIEGSILYLLGDRLEGLTNAQIARALGLQSDFNGSQRDYLTYSVLGGLLASGRVVRSQQTKAFSLST